MSCWCLCCRCLFRFDLTWGPIEYHRRSLDNLQTAMKKSRKLCAIVLDTLGREVGTAVETTEHHLLKHLAASLI